MSELRRPPHFFRRLTPLVALAASGILVLGAAPAVADPVSDLVDAIEDGSGGGGAPEQSPGGAGQEDNLPVAEDDDPDKEMSDPQPPDHGSADNAEVKLADQDVAAIGQTDATIEDDDSASADATALALGGNEIIGAHAEGNESNSAGDPLEPICSGSDGALCAQIVYAEATSSESNGAQHSESHTSVVNACVGGSDTAPEDCDGPVGASVLKSDSEIDRSRGGTTEASSSSSVAGVCLQPDPVTGACTIGADVVGSEGESSSTGTASKDSQVIGLSLPAEFDPLTGPLNEALSEPQAIELPPECPADMHVLCIFLNQGETYIGSGIAGHAVTALDATVLNGTVLATVSHSESLARQFPADSGENRGPGGDNGGPGDGNGDGNGNGGAGDDGAGSGGGGAFGPGGGDGAGAGDADAAGAAAFDDGLLPNTGGPMSGLLSIALLCVSLGSFLVAWSRRRVLAEATGLHGAA